MSNGVFTIDGYDFDLNVKKLTRSFEVSDSDSSGRTADWVMHRDVVGTFYNYKLDLYMKNWDESAYSKFYQIISSPQESHTVTFPYNNETLTFTAYVTKGSDTLNITNGINIWSGLSINFISMSPQRSS